MWTTINEQTCIFFNTFGYSSNVIVCSWVVLFLTSSTCSSSSKFSTNFCIAVQQGVSRRPKKCSNFTNCLFQIFTIFKKILIISMSCWSLYHFIFDNVVVYIFQISKNYIYRNSMLFKITPLSGKPFICLIESIFCHASS